jgi:hypothetical protein
MQNFMEIQDGHFQLSQKVADLAWNDSTDVLIFQILPCTVEAKKYELNPESYHFFSFLEPEPYQQDAATQHCSHHAVTVPADAYLQSPCVPVCFKTWENPQHKTV